MNIELTYLYHDAGNYKHWGEIVFANAAGTDPAILESEARRYLIDGQWFVAAEVGLPDLRPEVRDDELDHDWHEFHSLAATTAQPDDIAGRELGDWIGDLRAASASVGSPKTTA